MKLNVNFLRINTESFPSVGVQHCSISGKEKGCSFGESIVQILRIRGLFNSFAIAVLFQIVNRSFRSASTRMFDSQSLLQLLLKCLLLLCMLVSPSAKPDLSPHISSSQDNYHWFRKPILRNFQPA